MAEAPKKRPWLLRMHRQMRTAFGLMMLVATSLHMAGKNYSLAAWLLMGTALLAQPQLLYWRASRAKDVVAAEMNNLLIDSVVLGVFIAALEFPLWISFMAMLATLMNNATNKGWRAAPQTFLGLLAGVLMGGTLFGFKWSPDTDWPAMFVCLVGITSYLLAIGNAGFVRNLQLRSTGEKLQLRESALLAANEALQSNLHEIDELHVQLREQANRDSLTHLYNRHYLDSTLQRELAHCKREDQPLSLIMLDIDHFKTINDTHGHPAGDQVLIRLGEILNRMARAGDVACRFGGEEFLLVMPTMPLDAALKRSEELRATFAAMVVLFGELRLQATVSIGIAVFPEHGASAAELIGCADRALYRAKREGRNRVEVAATDRVETGPARIEG